MSVPEQPTRLRVLLNVFASATAAAVSVSFFATPSWGLLLLPVLLVCLFSAAPLVWFWSTTRGVDLKSALNRKGAQLVCAGPLVLGVWWVLGAAGLRLLAGFAQRPTLGGVLLALLTVLVISCASWLIECGAQLLAGRRISGRTGLIVFVSVLMVGVAGSVCVGNTSGSGNAWALFGVFKRAELDLSGVAVLVASAGLTWFLLVWIWRFPLRAVCWVWACFALLGGSAVYSAAHLDFKRALELERSGGVRALGLQLMRRVSDRDGDGHASHFAGGDCNDRSPSIHPAATEIFDNEVDENCDGLVKRPEPGPEVQPEAQPAPDLALKLPSGLNVLLLTVDTLRAELGFSNLPGTRAGISPELDRLAARSTVFDRAYSLASYTSKSLAPMLIGKYASTVPRSFEHFDRFPKDAVFVQERALGAGIRTLSIQGYWYFFFKGYGFERGWETLEHSAAPRVVAVEGDRTKNGDKVADDAIMYLKELADRPSRFFMWAHWVDPHAEYVAHPEHAYGPGERERYDGEVSFVDAQIGRILVALEQSKLADKTIVIVTSDHGEAFGEHGMIRHGFEVWDELVHVPLVVHVPGAPARHIEQRRSLVDVAPTILEALEVKTAGPDDLAGKSLLSDVLLPQGAKAEPRPVLVDMPEGPHNKERRAFYSGDHKLIVSSGRVLGLYDLKADPGEKRDLSEDAGLTARVRADYDAFIGKLQLVPATK